MGFTTEVTLALTSTAFSTHLYLFSATGILMTSQNGTPNSQIAMTLPAGTYYIAASSAPINATGAYTVSVGAVKKARGQITSQ
jgi:hypothetical protein